MAKRMTQKKKTAVLRTVVFLLWAAYIWGNSLLPGPVSQANSDAVEVWLVDLGGLLSRLSPEHLTTFVRKGAHILEYAVLGVLGFRAVSAWIDYGKRYARRLLPILSSVGVACADELIQTFVPGRAGMVSDVFVDGVGIVLGTALAGYIASKRGT